MSINIRILNANVTEGELVEIVTAPDENYNSSLKYDLWVFDSHSSEDKIIKLNDQALDKAVSEEKPLKFDTSGRIAGRYFVKATYPPGKNQSVLSVIEGEKVGQFRIFAKQEVGSDVTLHRSAGYPTNDQALWVAIRNRTNALSFDRYQRFIDTVFCKKDENVAIQWDTLAGGVSNALTSSNLSLHGAYAYSVLKFATQAFLTMEAGVVITDHEWGPLLDSTNQQSERIRLDDPSVTYPVLQDRLRQYLEGTAPNQILPYLNRIVNALLTVTPDDLQENRPFCDEILNHRFTKPSMLELIWSYWHEEGMQAQTMNAIAVRFQNQLSGPNDPLAELEIDPLRPLNNLIWGYIQDEHNRLTVRRRAFEYDHHYGIKLVGRAVPELNTADRRSKFIETFHNLLYRTAVFFREDADTTVIADTFPLLNALKDVHLLLAEGAHNQYGDLPWTSRAEMMTEQYMLARPEMREFLRGRHMVPYQEKWMGAVDAMKKLQGWTDTTITHFNELAVDGERILLSIRFGDWSDMDNTSEQAKNWARYWKPEIQRYLYGYLAITGVDLMADIADNREAATRYLQPSMLLQQRLAVQSRRPSLAVPQESARLTGRPAVFVNRALAESTSAPRYLKGA